MRWVDVTEDQAAVRAKWVRTARYALFTAAGTLLLFYPYRAAVDSLAAGYIYGGGACLLVGGVLSGVGSWFERWQGEALGLPPCFIAFSVFGVVLCAGGSLAAVATGLIFLGVALGIVDRWFTVMWMSRRP